MRVVRKQVLACGGAWMLLGCTARPADDPPIDGALAAYVLDRPPAEMEHGRFVDFGGKVHLLGYRSEPEGTARPGETVKVTMYWKSVDPLTPGWGLFTHLVNDYGTQIDNYDNKGPLRELKGKTQALPPSEWKRGKVYVDEQEITIPRSDPNRPWSENVTSRVTLVTGIWNEGARLSILSGPRDRENSAIVTHFDTGLERPSKGSETDDTPPSEGEQ